MAHRRRSVMLWALAAAAGVHGLAVLWLAAQLSILKFRADPVADRNVLVVELRPAPSAAMHPKPVVRPPVIVPDPIPDPEPAPSGPQTIDQGPGSSDRSNLARPVFLDWPHPVPAGVDWGALPKLALSGAWADCQRRRDKDEDAWAPAKQVRAPCLRR